MGKRFVLITAIAALLGLSWLPSNSAAAQPARSYLNPSPGAVEVSPATMLSLRWGPKGTNATPSTMLRVVGSKSGPVEGRLSLARDNATLIFRPARPFQLGETVTVSRWIEDSAPGLPGYSFTIRERGVDRARAAAFRAEVEALETVSSMTGGSAAAAPGHSIGGDTDATLGCAELDEVTLPPDFYSYHVSGNGNVGPGNYFICLKGTRQSTFQQMWHTAVLMILSPAGDVLWYYNPLDHHSTYFTAFPELELFAYNRGSTNDGIDFILMDTTYTPVDTIAPQNGFDLDAHELLLYEDGTRWILAREIRYFDMTGYGGYEDALVDGIVIQQLDDQDNVLWEWKSLDHLDELPFEYINDPGVLQDEYFEHLHTNSIELYPDGDLLISSRTTSLLNRIDRETGAVEWSMGGGPGNEFTFINDLGNAQAFWRQHDARLPPNGNITLFDNGTFHEPPRSYAREYVVDEENLTATLVWHYTADPPEFGWFTGSTRRFDNGNTLIGWGVPSMVGAQEIDSDGDVAWQFEVEQPEDTLFASYRYFKKDLIGTAARPYVHRTLRDGDMILTCNWFGHEDDIAGYNIYVGTSPHPAEQTASIDSSAYVIEDLEPGVIYYARIKALDSHGGESPFSNETWGQITPQAVGETRLTQPCRFELGTLYPNPFNPTTRIQLALPLATGLTLRIFDLLGREVAVLHRGRLAAGEHTFHFDGAQLAGGVYFIRASTDQGDQATRRMVLLK